MSASLPELSHPILALSSTAFAVIGLDGAVLDANPAFCKLVGRPLGELVGAAGGDFLHDDDRAGRRQILAALRSGELADAQRISRYIDSAGELHVCREKIALLQTDGQAPVAVVQADGIEDELRLAADLQRNAARTQTIIDHLPAMVAFWDVDFRNVYANRSYLDYFGWKPEDLRGHHIEELLGRELWTRNKPFFDQALAGKPVIFERTIRDSKGRDRQTVASYTPSWHEGKVEGVTVFVTDETELKQALAARLEAQSDLQAVLDAAVDFLLVATSGEGIVRTFSRGAERMLGYTASEVVGIATPALWHDPAEIAARAEELSKTLSAPINGFEVFIQQAKQGITERRDWVFIAKDGRRVPVSLVVSPIVGIDGNITGYLGVARDIAAEAEAREQTEAAMRAAESANRAKSQFLANMSHEIRTPMNAVLGVAELLAESPLNPQQAEYAGMILTAGQTLLQIISDILDISKIEAGKMEVVLAPFGMAEMLKSVEGMLSLKAQEKGLQLHIEVPANGPQRVLGDGVRLQQVLVNLVNNAIKFTHKGEVSLDVKVEENAEPGHWNWQFCVTDTGIGMSADQLQRIFHPFVQVASSSSRKYGGTGLGLSICKSLLELMGSTLTVTSEPERGSQFCFTVALAAVEAAEPQAATAPPATAVRFDGLRVLVVDDAALNQFVARSVLRAAGAHVACASDGLEAVELLRKDPAGFDVVLMDVQMPVMNGHEAVGVLRGELGLQVPVLGLSAGVTAEQMERCRAAGMDGFVGKPFQKTQLFQAIQEVLAKA